MLKNQIIALDKNAKSMLTKPLPTQYSKISAESSAVFLPM